MDADPQRMCLGFIHIETQLRQVKLALFVRPFMTIQTMLLEKFLGRQLQVNCLDWLVAGEDQQAASSISLIAVL